MNKLTQNILTAVFGLVIALVVVEVFFDLEPNFLPKDVRFVSTSVFDDNLRQAFKPNIVTIQALQDGVVWNLNTTDLGLGGIGFRDKITETKNIYAVAIGDSFTYGHGVNLESTWTKLLQVRAGGEVVNMGQPAAFSATQEKILESYASRLGPKLVIFTVYQNDWGDATSFETEKAGGYTGLKRTLDSYSSLYKLFRFVYGLGGYGSYKSFPHYTNGSVDAYLYSFQLGADVNESDLTIKHGEDVDNAAIVKAAQFANASGMKFVLLIFPSREQVYWDLVKQYTPDPTIDINRMDESTMQVCKENNITCLDMLPYMVAARDNQIFFAVDGHMNPAGHKVAADAIYNFLAQNKLLPKDLGT